jgi:hypothetical protein
MLDLSKPGHDLFTTTGKQVLRNPSSQFARFPTSRPTLSSNHDTPVGLSHKSEQYDLLTLDDRSSTYGHLAAALERGQQRPLGIGLGPRLTVIDRREQIISRGVIEPALHGDRALSRRR